MRITTRPPGCRLFKTEISSQPAAFSGALMVRHPLSIRRYSPSLASPIPDTDPDPTTVLTRNTHICSDRAPFWVQLNTSDARDWAVSSFLYLRGPKACRIRDPAIDVGLVPASAMAAEFELPGEGAFGDPAVERGAAETRAVEHGADTKDAVEFGHDLAPAWFTCATMVFSGASATQMRA